MVYDSGISGRPAPRPLPARIMDLIAAGNTDARDLCKLLEKGQPDWRVLRVICEIFIRNGYAGKKGMLEKLELAKRTAGSWHTLEADALHHRKNVAPPPNPPTLAEAQGWVMGLVRAWFDENSPP